MYLYIPANYIEDSANWGARQADGNQAAVKMPSSRKKNKKAPPPAAVAEEAEEVGEDDVEEEEDDVDALANHMESTGIGLETWHSIDRTQEYSSFANVWTDPTTSIRYVFIRIEFVGSTTSQMVKASFIKKGNAVEVEVKIRRGGELTNPAHLIVMYDWMTVDHPLYMAHARIHRFTTDQQEERRTIVINLPFPCCMTGFIDPLHGNNTELRQTYDLGVFPLPNQVRAKNAPAPSTKFLHLSCEEIHKPKIEQVATSRSFFPRNSYRAKKGRAGTKRGGDDNDDASMRSDNSDDHDGDAKGGGAVGKMTMGSKDPQRPPHNTGSSS